MLASGSRWERPEATALLVLGSPWDWLETGKSRSDTCRGCAAAPQVTGTADPAHMLFAAREAPDISVQAGVGTPAVRTPEAAER